VALKEPVACGVKVTLIWQEAALARIAPQVFELVAKSLAFVPVMVKVVRPTAAVPAFWTVTAWEALVELMACAANVSWGVTVRETPTPVPESELTTGLGEPLSPIWRLAAKAPAETGVNVSTTWQEAPPTRLAPQLVDEIAKSLGLAPASDKPARVIVRVPAFCTTTV